MNGIKRSLIEGKVLKNVILNVDYYTSVAARNVIYRDNEIQKNKIFFMTYDRNYTCNLKYIAEELIRQNLDVDLVWVVSPKMKTNNGMFPENIRLVKYGSAEMFEEMATAKVWFDNALNCVWQLMPKKKDQIYINTWHGSLGIKKLSGNARWLRRAARCKKVTDYCITNSTFEEDVFRTTFWPTNEFLKFGHARNDILMDEEKRQAARQKVLKHYELDPDVKIALYAPTFRDNGSTKFMNLSYEVLKKSLEKRFGGNWVILVRAHNKNRAGSSVEDEEYLVNANEYPDMQELMAATDAGVTDYSSWAFDYILTGRPLFLYAPDIADYAGGRGFYYPIETTPFPIAEDNEQIAEKIENFDDEKYQKDVRIFLKSKGCYEHGTAAKETVEFLKKVMDL